MFSVLNVFGSVNLDEITQSAYQVASISDMQDVYQSQSHARIKKAAALPNPTVFFEEERLSGGRLKDSKELRLGLSTSLDFLWKRGTRIRSAQTQANISEYEILNQKNQIRNQVFQLFVEYWLNQKIKSIQDDMIPMYQQFREYAFVSVEAGALPQSDFDKIDVLIKQLQLKITQNEIQQNSLKAEFALLTGIGDFPEVKVLTLGDFPFQDISEAMLYAYKNRPDWLYLSAFSHWKKTESKSIKRDARLSASLDVGKIRDEDGRDGTFIGLSIELPLFSEKRADALLARTESSFIDIRRQQLRRRIENEVQEFYHQWNAFCSRDDSLFINSNIQEMQLIESSFDQFIAGETSLLEHLDSINRYYESARSKIDQQRLIWNTFLNLSKATGAQAPLIIQ